MSAAEKPDYSVPTERRSLPHQAAMALAGWLTMARPDDDLIRLYETIASGLSRVRQMPDPPIGRPNTTIAAFDDRATFLIERYSILGGSVQEAVWVRVGHDVDAPLGAPASREADCG